MAVLARLLAAADFGLMAIVVALLAVIGLVSDFGISRAIIYFDDIDPSTLSSLFWLNLLLATIMVAVVVLSASVIADFYHQPRLFPVLLATAPTIVLTALGQQFCVLAEKELRFASLAQNEVLAGFAGFTVCIGAALAGAGVYALVASALVTAISGSLLAWRRLSTGHFPKWHFSLAEVQPYVRFGSYLVGENSAATLVRQADVFVGGLFVGPSALGIYSLPRDLSLRLAMVVNPIVTRVGFPVMAKLKHDRLALRAVYLKTLRMTASINFPLYVGLWVYASEIVALLYGPRWLGAIGLLRTFAIWGLVRSVGNPVGSLLYAVGQARRAFWWNIGQLLLLPAAYWLAARGWGTSGLASALVLTQLALVVPAWRILVRPCCGASLSEYGSQMGVPIVAASMAGGLAWATTNQLDHGTVRLAVGGVIGSIGYLAISAAINRQWLVSMLELLTGRRTDANELA